MTDINSMRNRLLEEKRKSEERAQQQQNGEGQTFRPKDPQQVNLSRINPNESVKIRFVPDGDASNDFFWRINCFHDLFFRGVKGDATKDNVWTTVSVPAYNISLNRMGQLASTENAQLNVPKDCVYSNLEDPIQAYLTQNKIFEKQDMQVLLPNGKTTSLYNALKRKSQMLVQGYIISAPESLQVFPDARPLKHFTLPFEFVGKIVRHLCSEETATLGDDPININDGVDFQFRKTMNGQFANYDSSEFSRIHTALPDAYKQDLATNGADFIGDRIQKTPSETNRKIIAEMLQAFLGGLPYDPAWDCLNYPKRTWGGSSSNVATATTPAAEPTWNQPQTTYVPNESQFMNAKEQADNIMASITGRPTVEQQVNDSIPYANPTPAQPQVAQPAQPVAQPQPMPQQQPAPVAGTPQTQDEVLRFLQNRGM